MNMTLANNSHPDSCPALVLNADYQPLSYYPLSLWSWQDAIKAVYLDRVNIVSTYDLKVRSICCISERIYQTTRMASLYKI
jgi:hypothetical protein